MSHSLAHDGEFDREPQREPLASELDAEIADHLALAARDFVVRGEAADAAQRAALARFGDVARIKRQCWWIHKGDAIMLRAAVIGLTVLVLVALSLVGVGGWQLQRTFDARTEALADQLAALNQTQQEMLVQQRPPEITGRIYLGDPSHPARDTEVTVYRWPDDRGPGASSGNATVSRRVRTDNEGRFRSGQLRLGDYCLVAPLSPPPGEGAESLPAPSLQSKWVYPMTGDPQQIDLNLLPSVRLRVTCEPTLPDLISVGDMEVPVIVTLQTYPLFLGEFPYDPDQESPSKRFPGYPPHQPSWPVPGPMSLIRRFPSDLSSTWFLPPQTYLTWVSVNFGRPKPRGSITADLVRRESGVNFFGPTSGSLLGDNTGMGGGMAGGLGGPFTPAPPEWLRIAIPQAGAKPAGGMGGQAVVQQPLPPNAKESLDVHITITGPDLAEQAEQALEAAVKSAEIEQPEKVTTVDIPLLHKVMKSVAEECQLQKRLIVDGKEQ